MDKQCKTKSQLAINLSNNLSEFGLGFKKQKITSIIT